MNGAYAMLHTGGIHVDFLHGGARVGRGRKHRILTRFVTFPTSIDATEAALLLLIFVIFLPLEDRFDGGP
ncbi:hypothetical protein BJX99DRAFT_233707 [Aspergillus californicus]